MRRLAVCLSLAAMAAAAVPAAQSPRQHFLWRVTHTGAPPTYLMGSIHVLTREYYPLSPPIEAAFKGSSVLITEADLDELTNPATAISVLGRALFTDGRTLESVIAPELYTHVLARAERAGVPALVLQRMKPWMAAVTLTMPALKAAGFEAELGLDRHFFDRAKRLGMERRALETVAYQFDRFDAMPLPLQEQMLRSVLADLDSQLADVRKIADAWARGDTRTVAAALQGSLAQSPALYDRLLVERNRNWVAPVEQCLQTRTACFVVVGAAHLVGPDSLVALLQARGYTVEQQ